MLGCCRCSADGLEGRMQPSWNVRAEALKRPNPDCVNRTFEPCQAFTDAALIMAHPLPKIRNLAAEGSALRHDKCGQ